MWSCGLLGSRDRFDYDREFRYVAVPTLGRCFDLGDFVDHIHAFDYLAENTVAPAVLRLGLIQERAGGVVDEEQSSEKCGRSRMIIKRRMLPSKKNCKSNGTAYSNKGER